MARWHTIPPELLLQCFEALSPTRGRDMSQQYLSLIACALVCSGWTGIAQTLLLQNAVPRTSKDCGSSRASVEQLVGVLAAGSLRAQELASLVRTLRLQIGEDIHYRGTGDQHACLDSVSRLLAICTHLQTLSLTQSALAPPGNVFTGMQMQRIRNHQNIAHLELIGDVNPPAVMYQLLHAWPGLQQLDIAAWSVNPASAHLAPRSSLAKLSAKTYGDPSALIAACAPTLRELVCGLNSLLCVQLVAHSLLSLSIDCNYPLRTLSDETQALRALASCTSLERVEVYNTTICPPALLEAIPASVVCLRLQCCVDATRLADVVRARPGLRHVEVEMITVRVRGDFADLHRVCRACNVRLNKPQQRSQEVSVY